MRVLVDENIPRIRLGRLWRLVTKEKRVLITTDKGFTEYRGTSHYGILIVRLRQPDRMKIHASVLHAVERFDESQWPGLLVVVRDNAMSMSRAGGPIEKEG